AAVDAAQAPSAQAAKLDLPMGNGELILVVDDENSIREIAKEALLTFGYQGLTAGDGTEALALFAQHRNEGKCVITDMMMPFMDGPAEIRALSKLAPNLKIIVTSGFKAEGKAEEAAQLGIANFLQKPYTAAALLKTLAAELMAK